MPLPRLLVPADTCAVVQIIKLSGAVQKLPREVIENVHGVAPRFLDMPEGGCTPCLLC